MSSRPREAHKKRATSWNIPKMSQRGNEMTQKTQETHHATRTHSPHAQTPGMRQGELYVPVRASWLYTAHARPSPSNGNDGDLTETRVPLSPLEADVDK